MRSESLTQRRLRLSDMATAQAKIFLSSTKTDLVAERAVVYQSLRDLWSVVRMEDFGSDTQDTWHRCAIALRDCDGYVLLLGHRYGASLHDSGLSYTQAEYEVAQIHGLATFIYMKDGIRDAIPNADDPVRLRDFLDLLEESHTIHRPLFRDLEELPNQVRSDLSSWSGTRNRRPQFHRRRRAISDVEEYAAGGIKRQVLEEAPFSVFVVDLPVAEAQSYPDHLNRRLGNKALQTLADLRQAGIDAELLNEIPIWASDSIELMHKRAQRASDSANLLICLVQGEADAPRLEMFEEHMGPVAIWHPHWLDLDFTTDDVVKRSYTPVELNNCALARDIAAYVNHVVDEHVKRSAPGVV